MTASDPVFVGKDAYYWAYIAPLARAWHAAHGRPVDVVFIDGAGVDDAPFIRRVSWKDTRRAKTAVTFDVWAMVHARARGFRVCHVHHSLVGKGVAFRGKRPFWPFFMADKLVLPHPDRLRDLPPSLRARSVSYGHVPFDWVAHDPGALPEAFAKPLAAWDAAAKGSVKVALLCTHGDFGAISALPEIVKLDVDGCSIGLRLHGYIERDGLVIPEATVDLGECPTTLAAWHADVVVTDHSSAAIEGHLLGKPVLCYRSGALTRLLEASPRLSELEYLTNVVLFDDVAALRRELARLAARARPDGTREPGRPAARPPPPFRPVSKQILSLFSLCAAGSTS